MVRTVNASIEAFDSPTREHPMAIKMTPMMQQYMSCKERYPDAILFFRMGDFYEMFFEDAQVVSRELGLTLTARAKKGSDSIPMAGIPHHSSKGYIAQLVGKGFTVAVAEQLDDPATTKGIVGRDVVRVITPGVYMDSDNLEAKAPNYVAAVDMTERGTYGLSYLDISTGDFRATELGSFNDLLSEMHRVGAREILMPDYVHAKLEPVQNQFEGAFFRTKHRAYFDPEGMLTDVAKGPRQGGIADAQSYFLDGEGVQRLLSGIPTAGFAQPEIVRHAASAVLRYILKTQRGVPSHLRALDAYRAHTFLVIDEATKANLELTETLMGGRKKGSLLHVIDHTVTAVGGRRLRQWLSYPLVDRPAIEARLDAVAEYVTYPALREDVRKLLDEVYDIERLCGRISAGTATPKDVRSLLGTLEVIPQIKDILSESSADLVHELNEGLDPCEPLCALIDRAVQEDPPTSITEGRIFKPGYNEELDEILNLASTGKDWMLQYEAQERVRTGITSLKIKFNKVFGYYLEVTKSNLKFVPEDYIRKQTLANAERYITEDLKEWEEKVLGAEDRRNTLELKMFEALRATIALDLERLMRTASELANLDVLSSLAELAIKREYTRPTITDDDHIHVVDGRHPVVEVSLKAGERFVPNDTRLSQDRRLAVITGPNMAGKSTIIRQVALLSLLAQMGSFVPAKEARLGLVDKIFSRVGASDNLARGQSTFMVEMTETAHILLNATRNSLVILDEIGRGTATYDGLSIAWAVAEHLHNTIGAKTLFATHYHELTELAQELPGAFNMSIAVKEWEDNIIFLRKLLEEPANRSYGIQVGRLAGLPLAVVDRAKEILVSLEEGHFDEIHAVMPDGSIVMVHPHHVEPSSHDVSAVSEAVGERAAPEEAVAAPPEVVAVAAQPTPTEPAQPAPASKAGDDSDFDPFVKPQAAAPQLSLFGKSANAQEAQVLEKLRDLSVAHMTPIQALMMLDELHRALGDK